MIAALAVLLIVERAAILLDFPFLYPVLLLTVTGMAGILGTFVWNLAGEVCDARQAKRLFPLFTSAGILGSVIGNAVTGISARLLGTITCSFCMRHYSACFLSNPQFRIPIFARERHPAVRPACGMTCVPGSILYASPLMRLIAYSSILFSSLLYDRLPIQWGRHRFPSRMKPVSGFFGLFNSITTVVTFLVSFSSPTVSTRLGIINVYFSCR
jgi:ATP/ADP translocase